MIRYTCPAPDRWTALLREDLTDGEQHDLEAHLDECPDCQRVLETCAADRSAWAAVPRWLATAESDAPLKTIIERLKHSPEDGAESTDMSLDFLDPSDQPGSLGRLGQYEILGEIGRGGMGVVLKALDAALHRVVAIKVLAPPLAFSASYRKRFTREARAAAAVCHEHVVTIHAVEEFKSLPYLVMQYVAGQSLQQKLDSCGPLPVADILRIGTQAAAGLAAAHAQGLVHRDIKPGNILLENGVERVRITDFGLARTIDDVGVTSSGVITGTPQYMAPEQARGQTVDARADLFSLGSVLYAMCTGEAPFHGSHALDVLRKVAEEQPQPIRELNYAIPPWLMAIVTKLMAKDPAQRYQSAAEVAELLERCLAHVQSPNTVSLPPTIHRFAHTRPTRISRWAALVLPILAGLFVVSEGTGATHIVKSLGTILRFRTPEGTLVVEVDDPAVKVTLDDKDLVITGAGADQEVRLKVGSHTVRATKDGQTKSEIVSIEKDGKATVKVSFEADGLHRPIANPNAKPAQPPFVKDQPRFTLQFHNEPWNAVFEGLTKLTGFPVTAKVKPTGTFTFLSPKTEGGLLRQYNLADVIDIVNEGLMQQHFLLIRRRERFIVVPTDEKIDLNYFEHVPSYELEQRGKTELVNYIVRIEHVRGMDARAELQKLLSPIGMATTIPGGGISISDKAENVRRIVQILTDLDRRDSDAPNRFGGKGSNANLQLPSPRSFDERKFVVKMPDEPWSSVFEWFAENSKMPVIDNYKPGGTFTLASPYECTLSVFFDHMNASLIQQKFLLVRRDKDFVVIRTDEKIDPALYVQTTIAELPHRCRSDLVSVVYRLGKLNAADAVDTVKKMNSALGSVVAEPVTNALLISDTTEHVWTIVRVLGELGNSLPGGAFDRNAKPGTTDQPTPGDSSFGGGKGAALVPKSATFGLLATGAPIALFFGPAVKDGLQAWNIDAGKEVVRLDIRGLFAARHDHSSVPNFAISSDGKRVGMTLWDMLYVWDATSGKSLIGSTVHAGEITALAFEAHGKLVATAGKTDEQVRVFDVASGNEVRKFPGFKAPATVLAFSADGTKLLASDGSVIQVFSVATGEEVDHRMPIGGNVRAAAFTPNGQIVAIAGQTILYWRPEASSKVQQIDAKMDLESLSLTPIANRVLVADHNVVVPFDLSTGKRNRGFAPGGIVHAVRAAVDGRSICTIVEVGGTREIHMLPIDLTGESLP